jgi:hypothetical protein
VGFEPTIPAGERQLNLKYFEHFMEDFYTFGLWLLFEQDSTSINLLNLPVT